MAARTNCENAVDNGINGSLNFIGYTFSAKICCKYEELNATEIIIFKSRRFGRAGTWRNWLSSSVVDSSQATLRDAHRDKARGVRSTPATQPGRDHDETARN